jgi:hypothetical protein
VQEQKLAQMGKNESYKGAGRIVHLNNKKTISPSLGTLSTPRKALQQSILLYGVGCPKPTINISSLPNLQ